MNNKWFCGLSKRVNRSSVLLSCIFALTLAAWVPSIEAGTPEWLRTAAQSPVPHYSDDTNAVVLWDEQVTTVKDNGEIKTQYRRAYKILRPEGRDHGIVTVYFDNETRLTYLKAWSIPADGKDYEVREKDAVETAFPGGGELYQDTRYKLLKIPAAEPGNVIGYEYEQKQRPYILEDVWRLQVEIPVRRARYVLRLPEGWEFDTVWVNRPAQKPVPTDKNEWVWDLQDIAPVEEEPAMPDWRSVAGWLAVTYFPRRQDTNEKSPASWSDIGRWYARLVEGRRQASPEIRQKVAELTSATADVMDKTRALAAFVQKDIRYVAIKIGIGGYQPHPAQDVFKYRYGDCKDKVTLLRAMLHEIGVESYYVLIHHNRGVVKPEAPTLGFDHAILAIRLPQGITTQGLYSTVEHKNLGKLLVFDPTDELTPLGFLPQSLQANYGLLVTEQGGELIKLPLLPPTLNRLFRSAKLALTSYGALYGDVHEIRWGAPAAALRFEMLKAQSADSRKKVLEDFLGKFLGGFDLRGYEVENLEKLGDSLVVHYRFVAESYAKPGRKPIARPATSPGPKELRPAGKGKEREEVSGRVPLGFLGIRHLRNRAARWLPGG